MDGIGFHCGWSCRACGAGAGVDSGPWDDASAQRALAEHLRGCAEFNAPSRKELLAALRKYGEHTYECDARHGFECSCGLDALLKYRGTNDD